MSGSPEKLSAEQISQQFRRAVDEAEERGDGRTFYPAEMRFLLNTIDTLSTDLSAAQETIERLLRLIDAADDFAEFGPIPKMRDQPVVQKARAYLESSR